MTPDQAVFLRDVNLPAVQNESKITHRVLSAIPADNPGFKPYENSPSALDLAWHIAAIENMFARGIISGQFDFTGNARPDSVKSAADVAEWYQARTNENLEALAQLTPEQLLRVVDFRGVLKMPAVEFFGILMHHSIHHRGQLSTYLRPMGGKVPSIYGESFDDAQARKAAAQK